MKEKSILLAKMMQYVEKRFPEDAELNAQFLELVNFVYRDESLKNTELTSKLEQAFLAGLRCTQPHIRSKFFEVFDASMKKRLHERLMYVVCSQNWDAMGPFFWIKQCIELLMATASPTVPIHVSGHSFSINLFRLTVCFSAQNCTPSSFLPAVTSVIGLAEPGERNAFHVMSVIKEEPADESLMMASDREDDLAAEIDADAVSLKRETDLNNGRTFNQVRECLD